MSNRIEEITKRGLRALDSFYSGKPIYDLKDKCDNKERSSDSVPLKCKELNQINNLHNENNRKVSSVVIRNQKER